MPANVVTLTVNPAIDRSLSVGHVTPDVKLRCQDERRDPGGGGINVSRAVDELGGTSLALWTKGGPYGELFAGLIDDTGIEHRAIPINGLTRQNLIVHDNSSDRAYRFIAPGPELTAEDRQDIIDAVSGINVSPDYLVLSGSLPPGAGAAFYAEVSAAAPIDCCVCIDSTSDALRHALQRGVYLAKPNVRELSELVGEDVEGTQQIIDHCRRFIDDGSAEIMIVSLGAGGVVGVADDYAEQIHAPSVEVVSKVGAGDSMVGGIIYALSEGEPIDRAIRYGVAAGTAAVTTPGTELCKREDTERIFSHMMEG